MTVKRSKLVVKSMMLIAIASIVMCVASVNANTLDMTSVIAATFGDKASVIIASIAIVGYSWSQLRQLIPAAIIAKLPTWLIWMLEVAAANRGHSNNHPQADPKILKQRRAGKRF